MGADYVGEGEDSQEPVEDEVGVVDRDMVGLGDQMNGGPVGDTTEEDESCSHPGIIEPVAEEESSAVYDGYANEHHGELHTGGDLLPVGGNKQDDSQPDEHGSHYQEDGHEPVAGRFGGFGEVVGAENVAGLFPGDYSRGAPMLDLGGQAGEETGISGAGAGGGFRHFLSRRDVQSERVFRYPRRREQFQSSESRRRAYGRGRRSRRLRLGRPCRA